MASTSVAIDGFAIRRARLARASGEVFRDLDFRVEAGEIHAVVGPKNAGKSCLCSLLSGDIHPDSGEVLTPPGARVAKVTGALSVFPNLTVGNNLILGRDESWRDWLTPKQARLSRLRAWLAENGVELALDAPLHRLPKEEWMFVQILNRLYLEPDLLILDEALEFLSPSGFRRIWPLLAARRERGMAVLWVTDKVESALVSADRVSVLRDGRILLTDSARRLDRLSLIGLCHGLLETAEHGAASGEQFHQMMRFTEALLRDLPNAVIITDMNRTVRFVNQSGCDLFGLPRQWPMEARLESVLGAANARLASVLEEGFSSRGEREWHAVPVAAAGGKRLADVRMRLALEGEISVGYMVVIEDVSLREEMRQRLTLSENLASVGLLAAGVAHEVNNPLEVMENYLNYLSETEGAGERREVIGEVIRETRNIRETVRQLVAFSGHRDGRRVKTDMARLAKQLCSLLDYHVRARGIEFACREPGRRVLVVAAPNEMRQMLMNLLRNSIDAMPGGGTVAIDMAIDEGDGSGPRLRLVVEDGGTGIEEERMREIFLPFVSTKNGSESHQGLGLSIVYAIVENCGGTIGVENRAEGGCRFTVMLPCLVG